MKIKELIRSNSFVIKIRLFMEMIAEFIQFSNHLASINTRGSEEKMRADLIIRVHSLEKGLALPRVRIGFGENKIDEIYSLLDIYVNKYGRTDFLDDITPVIIAYFEFNKKNGCVNESLWAKYNFLLNNSRCNLNSGGVKVIAREEIEESISFDYDKFISTRYSVRDFSDKPVSLDLIRKAIQLSIKSPSACNRQPWRVYVFKNKEKKKEILNWQMGNKGFTDQIDSALLITCRIGSYFINETKLPYVDGGLYAMNIMYAFHSLGIGSIPLTTAMMNSKSKELYSKFGINKGEVPIVLIGIGNLKDHFSVAISHRVSPDNYTTIIE
jgi:nitroreductase